MMYEEIRSIRGQSLLPAPLQARVQEQIIDAINKICGTQPAATAVEGPVASPIPISRRIGFLTGWTADHRPRRIRVRLNPKNLDASHGTLSAVATALEKAEKVHSVGESLLDLEKAKLAVSILLAHTENRRKPGAVFKKDYPQKIEFEVGVSKLGRKINRNGW